MKSLLSLASGSVQQNHRMPCMSFVSNLHSVCGMVWFKTLRVKYLLAVC